MGKKPVVMKFLMRLNLVSVHWTLILMYKQIMERKEGITVCRNKR